MTKNDNHKFTVLQKRLVDSKQFYDQKYLQKL